MIVERGMESQGQIPAHGKTPGEVKDAYIRGHLLERYLLRFFALGVIWFLCAALLGYSLIAFNWEPCYTYPGLKKDLTVST